MTLFAMAGFAEAVDGAALGIISLLMLFDLIFAVFTILSRSRTMSKITIGLFILLTILLNPLNALTPLESTDSDVVSLHRSYFDAVKWWTMLAPIVIAICGYVFVETRKFRATYPRSAAPTPRYTRDNGDDCQQGQVEQERMLQKTFGKMLDNIWGGYALMHHLE